MKARVLAWLETLGDQFWLRPAIVVMLCLLAGEFAVWIEAAGMLRGSGPDASPWGYSGGAEGARSVLTAIASSSIGVAGTIFSITIAALSLASGQMGPRLLRNFVRDGRNQFALGIFVGTFAYSLLVVRTVRSTDEGAFVPHAAVTGAIVLAIVCIATLVWFVHHIATSINVEQVVDTVHADLVHAIEIYTLESASLAPVAFAPGSLVALDASNYVQAVDVTGLADWAAASKTRVRLLVRPGDYVPAGLPIAEVSPGRDDAKDALRRAIAFGRQQTSLQDLEFSIRQLTEIAVRALSPGINDPFTASSVLERLGDALCRIAPRFLPTGVVAIDGEIILVHPVTDYDGMCDAMFHPIRQNAATSGFVLIRMLDVLIKVAQVERAKDRVESLGRHATLIFEAGRQGSLDQAASADLHRRWDAFNQLTGQSPAALPHRP